MNQYSRLDFTSTYMISRVSFALFRFLNLPNLEVVRPNVNAGLEGSLAWRIVLLATNLLLALRTADGPFLNDDL